MPAAAENGGHSYNAQFISAVLLVARQYFGLAS